MTRSNIAGPAMALAVLIAATPHAHAQTTHAHAAAPVRAEQAWARATAPQQKVGGAYVTLISPINDTLIGGTSPVAARVEVHEMRMEGDVMRMRELPDGLALPAGQAVALKPGGFHIMLMDLKQPLVPGQPVPVQLRFRTAPPLDLQLQIAPIGAQGPGTGSGSGMTAPMNAMPGHTR